jgi:hypothetical protein
MWYLATIVHNVYYMYHELYYSITIASPHMPLFSGAIELRTACHYIVFINQKVQCPISTGMSHSRYSLLLWFVSLCAMLLLELLVLLLLALSSLLLVICY